MDKLTMAKGRQVTIQDQELVRRREENKNICWNLTMGICSLPTLWRQDSIRHQNCRPASIGDGNLPV